jgi:hypothetical protein
MFCLQVRPRNNVLFTFELLRSHIETNLTNAALLMWYHEPFLRDWLARHNLRWRSVQLADMLNKTLTGNRLRGNRKMNDDYLKLKQHTLNVFRPHCAPLLPPPPDMDTPPPRGPHRIPDGHSFEDYVDAVDEWSYAAACIATVWWNYAAAAKEDAVAIAPMLPSQHIDNDVASATVWSLHRAADAATDACNYAAASALARSRYAAYARTAWSMHTDGIIADNAANADATRHHNLAAIAGSNLADAARKVWANYSFHATGTGSQHAAALAANSQHAAVADARSQTATATATRWSEYAAAWSQYAAAAAAAAGQQPPVGADDDDTMLGADDDEEHPPVVAAAAAEPLLLGAGDDDTPQPLGTQLAVAATPLSSLATKIGSQPTLGSVAASLASLSEGTESEYILVASADLTITLVETTDGTVTPPASMTPPSSGGSFDDESMIFSVETTAEVNSAGPLVPAAADGNLLDQSASDMSILHDSHDDTPMSFSVVEDIDEHVPYDLDKVGCLFGAKRRARVLKALTKRVSNLNVWETVATYQETVAALGYHIPLARAKNKPGRTGKCVLYMGIQPHRVVIRKGVVVDPGYIAGQKSWKRQAHAWRQRLLESLEETMMLAPEL